MYSLSKTVSHRSKKLPLLITALVVLILAGVGIAYARNRHASQHVNFAPSSATPTTGGASANSQKGEVSQTENSSNNTNTSDGSQPGDSKSNTGGAINTALVKPTGDFVSAHHVSTSTSLTSVCNTTAGANCTIVFTASDGTTKKLAAQTTDRGGSTYWNSWTPASIGLFPGSWAIQATATLNGQTLSTNDAMALEVVQ